MDFNNLFMTTITPDNIAPLSHSIEDYPDGIVLAVDKPYRWTSADVIRKVKWLACRHFGKKNLKVGHAGTLDPLATGVLLVCIGNATKRAEQLQAHDKEYIAGISFGATTPSYDLEKDIEEQYNRFPILEKRKDQFAGTLSGGEQQMLAVARGLMSRPKILLLDEPSMGLAPIIVNQIYDLIREIRDSGITVLLVEQNARKALGICDYAYVLENGKINLEGAGEELLKSDAVRKAYLGG